MDHLTFRASLSSTGEERKEGGADAIERREKRVDSGDWTAIGAAVNDFGGALLPRLLTPAEARRLRNLYARDQLFRATIDMGPRRYGSGQFRYLRFPYPEPIEQLERALYPRLCRSPGIGGAGSDARRRGRTASTNGWISVMPPARKDRRP